MLPTLILHLGTTFTRFFLFSTDGKRRFLTETGCEITLKDSALQIESLKARFEGRFEELVVISSDELFLQGARLLSKLGKVLVIDVGSEKTAVAYGSYGKIKTKLVKLGLGQNAGKLLSQVDISEIAALVPQPLNLVDIENYLGKKTLYPAFVPFSKEELMIEIAATTLILQVVKKVVEKELRELGSPAQFVFLTGAVFGQAPSLGLGFFPFLQGWQPTGVAQIFIDPSGFLYPYAFWDELEDLLSQFKILGTLINLTHSLKDGEVLGDLSFDLGIDENLHIVLKSGEVTRVPFTKGGNGSVEISLKKGVSTGGVPALKQEIDGGALGIVIDGRSKPLPVVFLNQEGKCQVKNWIEILGGVAHVNL